MRECINVAIIPYQAKSCSLIVHQVAQLLFSLARVVK